MCNRVGLVSLENLNGKKQISFMFLWTYLVVNIPGYIVSYCYRMELVKCSTWRVRFFLRLISFKRWSLQSSNFIAPSYMQTVPGAPSTHQVPFHTR